MLAGRIKDVIAKGEWFMLDLCTIRDLLALRDGWEGSANGMPATHCYLAYSGPNNACVSNCNAKASRRYTHDLVLANSGELFSDRILHATPTFCRRFKRCFEAIHKRNVSTVSLQDESYQSLYMNTA